LTPKVVDVRVRGTDVAGRVEVVGKDVTPFHPGDEVLGICDGSFAEYATARKDEVAPRPASLTVEQAATDPTCGFTALQGLLDVGIPLAEIRTTSTKH
jgi:NADPH:quinone reductase-like Zn-dependent oxidoreductase